MRKLGFQAKPLPLPEVNGYIILDCSRYLFCLQLQTYRNTFTRYGIEGKIGVSKT